MTWHFYGFMVKKLNCSLSESNSNSVVVVVVVGRGGQRLAGVGWHWAKHALQARPEGGFTKRMEAGEEGRASSRHDMP